MRYCEGMTESKESDLNDLLSETRILLPGAELLAAFLVTLPFTSRFENLTGGQRYVYLIAFFMTIVALACLLAPAAYHRVARPIHDKEAFKRFANGFVVVGLIPFTVSLTLVSYLVTSIVINDLYALVLSGFVAVLLTVLWWVVPYLRAHDRFKHHS